MPKKGEKMPEELKAKIKAGQERAKAEKLAALSAAPPPTVKGIPDLSGMTEEQAKAWVRQEMTRILAEQPAQPQATQQGGVLTDASLERILERVQGGKTNEQGLMREDYVPAHDQIPTVTFFVPYVRYEITGKPIGDTWTAIPLNRKNIFFKESYSYMIKTGKVHQRKAIATYKCNSRSIYEWITGKSYETQKPIGAPVPEFGTIVFLDVDATMQQSANSVWATLFQKNIVALTSKPAHTLPGLGEQYGITASAARSNEEYRHMIAEKMTDNELNMIENKRQEQTSWRDASKLILDAENVHYAQPTA